jgi:hypothetical protein
MQAHRVTVTQMKDEYLEMWKIFYSTYHEIKNQNEYDARLDKLAKHIEKYGALYSLCETIERRDSYGW